MLVLLRYKGLVILFLLLGCAPNSELEKTSLVCNRLQIGESCHTEGAREVYLEVQNFQPNEEYILFIQSFQEDDFQREYRLRFRLSSNVSSGPYPAWEQELERQLRFRHGRYKQSRDINESISLPNRFYQSYQSIDPNLDFYIPNLSDYRTESKGELIPFYVRTDDNPTLKGEKREFDFIDESSSLFKLYLDKGYAAQDSILEKFSSQNSCLEEVLEDMFNILGKPLDLDRREEIDILISRLDGGTGDTIGVFNKLDRFKTFRGNPIPDSNYGEYIYISPRIAEAKFCTTTAHELQHLINFDAKVLKQIPRELRAAMESIDEMGLRPEHDGLNEAFSYLVEMLSGKYQNVFSLVLRPFLVSPNLATYSIPMASTRVEDNLRSRGLNTLFLLHALRRAKGSFDWKDSTTQEFLKRLILSPETGFNNVSKLFNENPRETFNSFYTQWAMSLFHQEAVSNFIPREIWSDSNIPVGFKILSRDADPSRLEDFPNSFHPLQTELQVLHSSHSWTLFPEGVSIFRLIVPETLNAREKEALRLNIQGSETPYGVFVVRVR